MKVPATAGQEAHSFVSSSLQNDSREERAVSIPLGLLEMGKGRQSKDLGRARRTYSEYNATNYLLTPEDEDVDTRRSSLSGQSDGDNDGERDCSATAPPMSKHALYQRAVQNPSGDISYLQKFFLVYVGGRTPLHLYEHFCGTALICAQWALGDSRRTAVGLDLDEEALRWGLQHNAGLEPHSRVRLFLGNVINPLSDAQLIRARLSPPQLGEGVEKEDDQEKVCDEDKEESGTQVPTEPSGVLQDIRPADIVCALNYSCCCLRKRSDLVKYFSEAFKAISSEGGIFAMDLYGGLSSESSLKIKRRLDGFQYTWEQEEFDIISRTTTISLHFRRSKNQGVLRHAFTYHWRLWTLPEVKECLEEAHFHSVHIWIRRMPSAEQIWDDVSDEHTKTKYEEARTFSQEDSWNAYVVAVRKKVETEIPSTT